jgi:hypothetical protein
MDDNFDLRLSDSALILQPLGNESIDEKSTFVMISEPASVLIRDFKTGRNVLTCTGKPTHSRILHC